MLWRLQKSYDTNKLLSSFMEIYINVRYIIERNFSYTRWHFCSFRGDQKILTGGLWKKNFEAQITNTIDPKIILQNYILYWGESNYVGIFPVYLRIALIFTDFPTGSGSQACAFLEICDYQDHSGNFPT